MNEPPGENAGGAVRSFASETRTGWHNQAFLNWVRFAPGVWALAPSRLFHTGENAAASGTNAGELFGDDSEGPRTSHL